MSKKLSRSDDGHEAITPPQRSTDDDALQHIADAQFKRAPQQDVKLDFDEETRTLSVYFDGDDQAAAIARSMVELGVIDYRVYEGLLHQVAALGEQGQAISEKATNFALGLIASIQPRDEVEALLAAQMAATHQASMMMARRLTHVETIQQQDAAEKAFNKLARTYTTQMQTLKKYRAKAQQTVRVERVTVEEGGQAIVGDVAYQRGADGKG